MNGEAKSADIIPKIANKFNKDEKWAKNLYEWHKDSSPLTKEADGTPKVFYHGSPAEFEVFDKNKINTRINGFWFAENPSFANSYTYIDKNTNGKLYETFINAKKPFDTIQGQTQITKDDLKRIFGKDIDRIFKDLLYDDTKWQDESIIELLSALQPHNLTTYPLSSKIVINKLQKAGYDSITGAKDALRRYIVVFEPNQIKSVENVGKFDSTNPNILQANQHLGAGLFGGALNGIETDEDGNIIGFSPEKFVLGFLGGAGVSKSMQFLAKKAQTNPKARDILNRIQAKNATITQKFFNKGKNQMAQKPQEPKFEVTKELEKTYRNAQIVPKESLKTALELDGRVVGDFIKLAQKHPEYFANPKEAQMLCQSVLNDAKLGLNASNKAFKLIIAPVKDERGEFGGVALRVQNTNGEHRIRSVLFMDKAQVETKLKKAKELGEPILQF